MKIKQTILALALVVTAGFGLGASLSTPASADCAGVKTAILSCDGANNKSSNVQDNAIWKLLLLVLNIMTAGVGIVAVGGIVYGSILYTSAGDRQDQTKKAIGIITNVVIGLVAYALMYLVLNFLIPGGIFS